MPKPLFIRSTSVAIVLGYLANVTSRDGLLICLQLAAVDIFEISDRRSAEPCARSDGHHPVAGADQYRGIDGEGDMLPIIFGAVWAWAHLAASDPTEPLVTVFRSISPETCTGTHSDAYAPVRVFALISVTARHLRFSPCCGRWPS